MEKCSACGAPLQNGTCPYCGATYTEAPPSTAQPQTTVPQQPQIVINQAYPAQNPQSSQTVTAPLKDKWVAFILCLLFGILGVHYFYVGKAGIGILYLFTLGLFGIGWIVDIIRILVGSFYDRYGRRLQG